jgi:hypothetical protein
LRRVGSGFCKKNRYEKVVVIKGGKSRSLNTHAKILQGKFGLKPVSKCLIFFLNSNSNF